MRLNLKIFEQTGYGFVFQIQKFVLSSILNIVIINALPRDQYGIIGIVAGYFVFVAWFLITPETILIQRYQEVRSKDFNNYLSKLSSFILLRTGILISFSFLIALILLYWKRSYLLAVAMVLYTAAQLFINNSGSLQFILKIDFKQKLITKWSLFFKIGEILLISILFVVPDLLIYLTLLLIVSFVEW